MRMGISIVAVIILSFIAFGLWAYMRPERAAQVPEQKEKQETPQIQLTEKTLEEENDVFKVSMRYPQFGIPAIDTQVQGLVTDAAAEFTSDSPDTLVTSAKYELMSTYDKLYVGDGMASTRLAISSYMGGAHPNTGIVGLNYELSTGKQLSLNDALSMIGMTLGEVASKADAELSKTLREAYFKEGAEAKVENYETFIVSADAVTFIFQQYQVAPYAAGVQEVSFKRK
ncbi:DUF3298 and DUF4163 domain-containing protein [Candidatus Kaiserbacteria bacterium]|nr:DUF3298 and DUF4163 domain-containing protein [Candidatus Kaiserbacteria bacterium]